MLLRDDAVRRACFSAFSVTLAITAIAGPARGDSGEVIDPHEVVDPEEVVDEEGEPLVSGPASSLCIIHEAPDISRFLFIPYAEHDMWRPCRDKNRVPMSYAEFYSAVGRPELADEHDRIYTIDTALFWSQFAMTLGAFGFTIAAIFKEESSYWWPAGGLFAGAITLSIIRGAGSSLPIDSQEALRLASGYNDQEARTSATKMTAATTSFQLFVPVVALHF